MYCLNKTNNIKSRTKLKRNGPKAQQEVSLSPSQREKAPTRISKNLHMKSQRKKRVNSNAAAAIFGGICTLLPVYGERRRGNIYCTRPTL
jgi:hypothetical protein